MARKCLLFVQWGSVWLFGCDWGGRFIYRGSASAVFCEMLQDPLVLEAIFTAGSSCVAALESAARNAGDPEWRHL